MKKFNFKKLGILAVIMLAGALVLVGPASAYSQVYTDSFRFRCGGSSGNTTSYWATVETVHGQDAGHIQIAAALYDQCDVCLGIVSDSESDANSLTVQGYYSGAVPGGYVKASFDAVNPTEHYYDLICYFY